jgi:regulator of sigma E protease
MILNVIIGLLGLGLVVFFHEAGHLLAAKAVGIDVEAFSVGWGKKLFGKTWRGTEYRISAFPVGGYCKMKGEESLQLAWSTQAPAIPKEPGSFFAASPWRRIIVAAAGPAVNVLFSIVVLSLVWYIGFSYSTFENRVVLASDNGYPAHTAGLETGDRVIAIDSEPVENYREIQMAITRSPDEEVTLTVDRDGRVFDIPVVPNLNPRTGGGQIGVYPWIDPVIQEIRPGSGADLAGLQPGDRIRTVNGTETPHSLALASALSDTSRTAEIGIERDGDVISRRVTLGYTEDGRPELGITFESVMHRSPKLGIFGGFTRGVQDTWMTVVMYLRGLGMLFSGVDLTEAVAGPVRITYIVGEVATEGFSLGIGAGVTAFFNFLSLISVALFIMNLLPIPALDGGQILLFLFESLSRRDLSPRLVYRYQMIGTVIVLVLIVFALFNDILFLARR